MSNTYDMGSFVSLGVDNEKSKPCRYLIENDRQAHRVIRRSTVTCDVDSDA